MKDDLYDYLTADTIDSAIIILGWIKAGNAKTRVIGDRWVDANWVNQDAVYRRMKPQPYVILTNPEEILRGIQAGVVERLNTNVAEWGKPPASTLEEVSSSVNSGCIYRLKPGCQLPPKKVLRDRRPEEFWPLLGKWWGRYTHTKNDRFIISDSSWYVQHNKEIAPLGTEDWQPMMVEE